MFLYISLKKILGSLINSRKASMRYRYFLTIIYSIKFYNYAILELEKIYLDKIKQLVKREREPIITFFRELIGLPNS